MTMLYKTAQVAKIIGIHPNTVRLYEEYGLITLTKNLLAGIYEDLPDVALTRRQAAQHLGLTIDTIRNWELNGLITITRMHNGYRVYTQKDLNRLKIIRSLRCANYSLSAILRMLNALSNDQKVDIREVINTPHPDEDIFRACDQLLTSLKNAEANARWMLQKLYEMEEKFAHGFNY